VAFKVFQAMWGMMDLPHGEDREWSLSEKLEMAAAGGFDGVDIAWTPLFPASDAIDLAHRNGRRFGLTCFPRSVADFKGIVEAIGTFPCAPEYVNLQPNVRVFTVAEGVPVLREWLKIASDANLDVKIETHRDRMTTDLRFTLQLIDALPELRLTADLSHYVVGEEFQVWPVSEENHALIRRIIQRADLFHGRVASREQVQITAGWDVNKPWLELFSGWWEEGFRHWHEHAAPDADLFFVNELGPPSYAISGQDGRELSDRWEDALFLQGVARDIWKRVEAS
jgi:sugar phosphate isomerase/epimerase